MKQIVYTCARCDKQEAVDPNQDSVPMEWAAIQYTRVHTTGEGRNFLTTATTCESHACGDCAQGMLDYVEGGVPEKTAPQVIADHASTLMHINAKMFEDTIRVLGQQNMRLHESVAELTAVIAVLRASTSREPLTWLKREATGKIDACTSAAVTPSVPPSAQMRHRRRRRQRRREASRGEGYFSSVWSEAGW